MNISEFRAKLDQVERDKANHLVGQDHQKTKLELVKIIAEIAKRETDMVVQKKGIELARLELLNDERIRRKRWADDKWYYILEQFWWLIGTIFVLGSVIGAILG